jgi:hypothetical protein
MKPVSFAEQTKVLNANPNQLEIDGLAVGGLPVFSDGEQCISCWRLNWWERLKVLLFGRVWLGIHMGATQPPVWLCAERSVFEPAHGPHEQ